MNVSNRRDFLRLGSLGFGGLNLPSLLAAEPGKSERACIVIFQNGGASQLDFFDPKPEAPHDVRGSFGSVATTIPGVHFSGLLPRTAKAFSRFAVIRKTKVKTMRCALSYSACSANWSPVAMAWTSVAHSCSGTGALHSA